MCFYTPYAMYPSYPNFTCVFPLCLSIFMHNIWDIKQTDVGEGCNFKVITFDYIYPFFLKKKKKFKNVSKMCSTMYGFNTPYLLCPKPLIIIGVTWISTSALSANI